MLPANMEIDGDAGSNLFDRLQSLSCFDDDDETVSDFNVNSTNIESFFKTPIQTKNLTSNDDFREKIEETQRNSHQELAKKESENNTETLDFYVKSELPDEENVDLPNGSGLNSFDFDAGPSLAAIEYDDKTFLNSNDEEQFDLVTISKRQASISVHTVMPEYVHKRGRPKKNNHLLNSSIVSEIAEEVQKKFSTKKRRTNRLTASGKTLNAQKTVAQNKTNKIYSILNDISSVDDVLTTWEAKMELQVACGFSASDNLSVEEIATEARSRIDSLQYQFSRASLTSKQLLRQQFELMKRIVNPRGDEEISLVKKKRIRPKYAEMIAKGLMLAPQEHQQTNLQKYY